MTRNVSTQHGNTAPDAKTVHISPFRRCSRLCEADHRNRHVTALRSRYSLPSIRRPDGNEARREVVHPCRGHRRGRHEAENRLVTPGALVTKPIPGVSLPANEPDGRARRRTIPLAQWEGTIMKTSLSRERDLPQSGEDTQRFCACRTGSQAALRAVKKVHPRTRPDFVGGRIHQGSGEEKRRPLALTPEQLAVAAEGPRTRPREGLWNFFLHDDETARA